MVKFVKLDDVPNLLIIVLILASVPLARRNLRARRGEHEGARRVGLLVFGCYLGSIVVSAHHTWTFAGEANILRGALPWSLYYGFTAALLYLALEPLVRRVALRLSGARSVRAGLSRSTHAPFCQTSIFV